MAKYEYRIVQSQAGAAIAHLNERINTMAEEGWEPIFMSGSETVNVMMRRPKPEAQQQGGQAQQDQQA